MALKEAFPLPTFKMGESEEKVVVYRARSPLPPVKHFTSLSVVSPQVPMQVGMVVAMVMATLQVAAALLISVLVAQLLAIEQLLRPVGAVGAVIVFAVSVATEVTAEG